MAGPWTTWSKQDYVCSWVAHHFGNYPTDFNLWKKSLGEKCLFTTHTNQGSSKIRPGLQYYYNLDGSPYGCEIVRNNCFGNGQLSSSSVANSAASTIDIRLHQQQQLQYYNEQGAIQQNFGWSQYPKFYISGQTFNLAFEMYLLTGDGKYDSSQPYEDYEPYPEEAEESAEKNLEENYELLQHGSTNDKPKYYGLFDGLKGVQIESCFHYELPPEEPMLLSVENGESESKPSFASLVQVEPTSAVVEVSTKIPAFNIQDEIDFPPLRKFDIQLEPDCVEESKVSMQKTTLASIDEGNEPIQPNTTATATATIEETQDGSTNKVVPNEIKSGSNVKVRIQYTRDELVNLKSTAFKKPNSFVKQITGEFLRGAEEPKGSSQTDKDYWPIFVKRFHNEIQWQICGPGPDEKFAMIKTVKNKIEVENWRLGNKSRPRRRNNNQDKN